MWSDNTVFTGDSHSIESFISVRSSSMFDYMMAKRGEAYFTMWYKSLTHSDLASRGKRTDSADGFERNLLYYLSVADMNKLQEQFPDKRFESAKQSNIGMPEDFYVDLKIPRIQRRKGKQSSNHNWISVNEYMPVYLVNDSLEYFSLDYSERIMRKLGKEMPRQWKTSGIVLNHSSVFTEIDLHQAVHGLGTREDTVFHALRLCMFLNDTIIFIVEHKAGIPQKLFILLEKNTMFYSLLGIQTAKWAQEERIRRYQERLMLKEGVVLEKPERLYENDWDDILLP